MLKLRLEITNLKIMKETIQQNLRGEPQFRPLPPKKPHGELPKFPPPHEPITGIGKGEEEDTQDYMDDPI